LEEANKLCILFAEALKFLRNTQYSIYGFETRDINTWVYKDKLYDKQKALIEPNANGGTAMGYHLASIGDKVINQYNDFDNKFMFVICDGSPTHGVDNMNSCQFTNHSIKLLRRQGIQVYGIGILNAFHERTGNEIFGEGNFTVIDDIKGSLSILTNRLRKYLQKSSKV
jgi:nitric oxide reductase activation protein